MTTFRPLGFLACVQGFCCSLFLSLMCIVSLPSFAFGQGNSPSQAIQRIDPPNWWIGMKSPRVELLVYGKNVGETQVKLMPYKGVKVEKIEKASNPNYVYLTLSIAPNTKPGAITLAFQNKGLTVLRNYELRARTQKAPQGFSAKDAMYLIMPDRFSNGDPSNDMVPGFPDTMHRDSLNERHGGDLQGIINRLDYIKDLGMTTIWNTPLIENNMQKYSYHGYAFTDFYAIDRRFGTNADYCRFVDSCHAKGLKVVMDVVLNHLGDQNYLALDPPAESWLNDIALLKSSDRKKDIQKPNYRTTTHSDPYASEYDKRSTTERWFDWMMPDFDGRDAHCATYLVQNIKWWVEYAGVDGLRIDTYPYPNKTFTAAWTKAIAEEYPTLSMVGEVWVSESVGVSAYWQANARNSDGFNSNLPAITDFPMNSALGAAFNEKEEWGSGLIRLYNTLAQDFLYPNAGKNVVFLDNHDVSRYFSAVQEDVKKHKMALAFLLTTRGTPQLYYGTEIAMAGWKEQDPFVRRDFPGGWKEDTANAFTSQGRNALQNEVFNHVKTLATWRKTKSCVHSGKLTHFVPFDGTYTYFRHNETESVMVVLNNNDSEKTISTERFGERLRGFMSAKNVLTGASVSDLLRITIPAKSALVLDLQK